MSEYEELKKDIENICDKFIKSEEHRKILSSVKQIIDFVNDNESSLHQDAVKRLRSIIFELSDIIVLPVPPLFEDLEKAGLKVINISKIETRIFHQ